MKCERIKSFNLRVDMLFREILLAFLLTSFFITWVVLLSPASMVNHFWRTGKNQIMKAIAKRFR